MNIYAVKAIYVTEMMRAKRTLLQSLFLPVISTSLFFIVFGSAIGGRMTDIAGIPYAAFIVPGLVMMTLLTESVSNASFGIHMPRFTGAIYEILAAPVNAFEVVFAFVAAAATKSVIIGCIILLTATLFVDYNVAHPALMLFFMFLTAFTFCLLGFIVGIWADGFEKLQIIPMMVIRPLTFLGGTFYSIDMLPGFWQKVALFNPVVYLISGFRWAFYETSAISIYVSTAMVLVFMAVCICIVYLIFKTGYKLRS